MTERLLQFIWQFQYFNKSELSTSQGEAIQILFHGQFNTNQGPDFNNAKIRIGKTTWAGTIELHIRASDWNKHGHQEDENYKNVILHVVWENDEIKEAAIPVLELKDRISKVLLNRYYELMNSASFIASENSIHVIPELSWKSWKERLVAERLLRKSKKVENYLEQNSFHWEETFWWLLARNFGMKVNADLFEDVARSIPLALLAKHKIQVLHIEALLLGQAGLLEGNMEEDYPCMLQKEYKFFKKKYRLHQPANKVFFLRMRPGNFPTIRLAQLAMLIHESMHLFSKIKEATSVQDVKNWMDVTANDYWHYHYRFDELSVFKKKKLGNNMIDNIIINTIVPVLFAYGNYHDDNKYKQKALDWLESTNAETNSIIRGFDKLGIISGTAYDSQALVELKTQYCDNKRCLECAVGNYLLRSNVKE
jgi:uncharacterized protein DUF2851